MKVFRKEQILYWNTTKFSKFQKLFLEIIF